MAPIYLFEDAQVQRLYPLTLSRPPFLLRVGGLTLLERLQATLEPAGRRLAGAFVRDGLAPVLRRAVSLPVNPAVTTREGIILVNARWLMTEPWSDPLENEAGIVSDAIVYAYLPADAAARLDFARLSEPPTLESVLPSLQRRTVAATLIKWPWDLLAAQRAHIAADFERLGPAQDATMPAPAAVYLLEPQRIHLARGVKIWPGAVLDASAGPIVVEAGTEIRPHATITGPVYIGRDCLLRTGADIRENTVLGPGCKVGGEIIASLFLGYSNKQHDGFLGQSIVGEWVNIGAGATASNLKNTYGSVRVPINGADVDTGRQFMGAIIADHAKIAIGTCLPTGSVIGFASHVLASRPPKFVPSFAWAQSDKISRIDFAKAENIARLVLARRGLSFTQADHDLWVRIAGDWATAEAFSWPPAAVR